MTPKTMPLMKKAQRMNIPMQIHVHIAYADIYHFKAAIETAGGTNDIKRLIKSDGRCDNGILPGKNEIRNPKG